MEHSSGRGALAAVEVAVAAVEAGTSSEPVAVAAGGPTSEPPVVTPVAGTAAPACARLLLAVPAGSRAGAGSGTVALQSSGPPATKSTMGICKVGMRGGGRGVGAGRGGEGAAA